MKIKLLYSILTITIFNNIKAQDIHFSQFTNHALLQNPALCGLGHDVRVVLSYREQWRSVADPFKTLGLSGDMKLNKKKIKSGFLAAGINVYNDKAGNNFNTTNASLNIAYHVVINQNQLLGAGVQTGFIQRSLNYTSFQTGSQFDGYEYNYALATGENLQSFSIVKPDVGAGISWHYDKSDVTKVLSDNEFKITLGYSLLHLNRPINSITLTQLQSDRTYMRHTVNADALMSIANTKLALKPSFLYYRQGPAQQIMVGTLIRYKLKQESKFTGYVKGSAFSTGAFYRMNDALAATVMFEIGNYMIGFSYDINTSSLAKASTGRGAFEINLRFVNPNPFSQTSSSRFY